jgi:hypothetical protein
MLLCAACYPPTPHTSLQVAEKAGSPRFLHFNPLRVDRPMHCAMHGGPSAHSPHQSDGQGSALLAFVYLIVAVGPCDQRTGGVGLLVG